MTQRRGGEENQFTRQEIQRALGQAVVRTLDDLGIRPSTLSDAHARRIVRALVRIGAGLARTQGWPLGLFLETAIEAYALEGPSTAQGTPKAVAQA